MNTIDHGSPSLVALSGDPISEGSGSVRPPERPPNHHADAGHEAGVVAYLSGLTMAVGRRRDAELVARIAAIDETDRVVDIGCGPGVAARAAARAGARVVGVDPSAPMLRLARMSTLHIGGPGEVRWAPGAAERLPLRDGSQTACWSVASVHHWRDLGAAITEVWRVLEPGGRFVALERCVPRGASGRASHGWDRGQAATFADMLAAAGFVGVQVREHDLPRRRLVSVSASTTVHRSGESAGRGTTASNAAPLAGSSREPASAAPLA